MKELLIEYTLRHNDYVFRCIHFAIDEDTGARSVHDIQEWDLRRNTADGMVMHRIWWPDFENVKIVASRHGDYVLMDEPIDDYFTAARRASYFLAMCVCDFKNVYDQDGELNTAWLGLPVIEAYKADPNKEDSDFYPYVHMAGQKAAIVGSACEADRGKVCHHGDTFGSCPSSQCHIWTEAELAEA